MNLNRTIWAALTAMALAVTGIAPIAALADSETAGDSAARAIKAAILEPAAEATEADRSGIINAVKVDEDANESVTVLSDGEEENSEDGTAATIGTEKYISLAAAVSASNEATSDVTVKLESDAVLSDAIEFSNSSCMVTLDLNGHSITRNYNSTYQYSDIIAVSGSLTVKDSSSDESGSINIGDYYETETASVKLSDGIDVYENGALTLESGTISGGVGIYMYGEAAIPSFTMNGGTVTGTGTEYFALDVGAGTVTVNGGTISGDGGIRVYSSDSDVTIEDGTVTGDNLAAVYADNGTVTVNGGTLSGYRAVRTCESDADVTINGGTLSGTAEDFAVYAEHGTVTVNDGEINGYKGIAAYYSDANVTINGGTITAMGERAAEVRYGKMTITGGIITAVLSGVTVFGGETLISGGEVYAEYPVYARSLNDDCTLSITGGTIGKADTTSALDELSYFGVTVFTEGNDGRTVTADISGGTITGYSRGVYIRANTDPEPTDKKTAFTAEVTISGDAEIVSTNNENYYDEYGAYDDVGVQLLGLGAVLNVKGGSISARDAGIEGLYTYDTDGSEGDYNYDGTEINISGGTVSGNWGIYHIQDGALNISGGTIIGRDTGIEICVGELNMTGGTVKSEYDDEPLICYIEEGTTTIDGAGIGISQNLADLPLTVNITGGDISGSYGIIEINTHEGNTSPVTITLSGDAAVNTTYQEGEAVTDDTAAAVYSMSLSGAGLEKAEGFNYGADHTALSIIGGTYNTDVSEYVPFGYCAEETEDAEGNTAYTVKEVPSGSVEFTVTAPSEDISAVVIKAIYDSNNVLKSIETESVTIAAGKTSVTVYKVYEGVSVMLWDSFDGLKPLDSVKTYAAAADDNTDDGEDVTG